MRKVSLFVVLMCGLSLNTQAQKVGINVPLPSEVLHVDSTIKIGKNNSINVSTPGRKNLLKFGDGNYLTMGEEVTDDKLYMRFGDMVLMKSFGSLGSGFIGIGTETPSANLDIDGTLRLRSATAGLGKVLTSDANGNATWQTGGLTLPFSSSDASPTSFAIANITGSGIAIGGQSFGTGVGVQGLTSGGKGIFGSANSGTGIDAYSNTGTAGIFTSANGLSIKTVSGNVEINGKIKMIDGNQALGKVLTSDGSGLATWQNLPADLPSIDFSCRNLSSYLSIPTGSGTKVTGWTNVVQAGGNNYNFGTSIYTIPVSGFYQINGSIVWDPIPSNCSLILSLILNGSHISQNYHASNTLFGISNNISCGRRFTVGDQISLEVYQNSGSSVNLTPSYNGHNFSIAFIHP